MKKLYVLMITGVLLVAATAAGASRWVNDRGEPGGQPVTVEIPPGSSGQQIAQALEKSGVVSSALAFRIYMKLKSVDSSLKAGEYELRQNMGFQDLVVQLAKGPEVEYVKLTVPEGFTIQQTAERVGRDTHIKPEDFLAAATPATVRPKLLPPEVNSLEGFLYPSTYFVVEREDAAALVRRMVREFERRTAELDWSKAQELGRTPYELLVIASLIEEEAKDKDERAQISAVIHNRLRKQMKLEIDATVQFAVGKYDGSPLTLSDLDVDSPYNTRKFGGIPPGPIASPRLGSIEAALEPAQSDALFYVLKPDCRTHTFTESYQEFLTAKRSMPRDC